MALLKPKDINLTDQDGVEHTYVISRIPACEAKEIILQYPTSAMPKIGDWPLHEKLMFKLMSYVAVKGETGDPLPLTTRALVNNHVPDWMILGKLELAMMDYNSAFFLSGGLSTFLKEFLARMPGLISKTLTDSLVQSLQTVKPPSKN